MENPNNNETVHMVKVTDGVIYIRIGKKEIIMELTGNEFTCKKTLNTARQAFELIHALSFAAKTML